MDYSFIVLAGGKSSRFGNNKLEEKIDQESLLQRVIGRLTPFGADIIIVRGQGAPLSSYSDYPGLFEICDLYPGKGPLGGIYSGLRASARRYNFVLAGDMPFLNPRLLASMMEQAQGYDLFVPRVGNFFEPLHAIYSKNCLPQIESLISRGELSILKLFPLVKTGYLESETIEKYDPSFQSFFNVNTQQDLAEARKRLLNSVRGKIRL